MRRISYWPYVFLSLFFMVIFSIPRSVTERLRSVSVCSFSPGWQALSWLKNGVVYAAALPFAASGQAEKFEELQLENAVLQSQLEQVREWLLSDDRMQEQYARLEKLQTAAQVDSSWKQFFKRRKEELASRLHLQEQSLYASVVFREPSAWSSALWVDVGEKQNRALGKRIVAKNSPVLSGTAVIGVVEYVGETRSRVRLITDERLVPSVRALRGLEHNRYVREHLHAVLFALERREDLFASKEEAASVLNVLAQLSARLGTEGEDMYLAKGEISGSSMPLWRARGAVLKGRGFNYDFADQEGPARDLRSGEPYGEKKEPVALLRVGDMLVTTGLDGVFPPGYRVALVSKVDMLQEGASSYQIEAVAAAGNFDEIKRVAIIPPID